MHNMNKLRKINDIKLNDNKEGSAFENNCEIDATPNSTKVPDHILLAGLQAHSLYKKVQIFSWAPGFRGSYRPLPSVHIGEGAIE